MSLEEYGRLWISSSDLTATSRSVKKAFNLGADTVVLKTSTREPDKNGKNFVIKDHMLNYYDFSKHKVLEKLIENKPFISAEAKDAGLLEGFKLLYQKGSLASYSHNGDQKMLSIDESNSIYESVRAEFPDKKVIQSLGISRAEDYELIDRLKGDAIELNLRYYHKLQKTPILISNNLSMIHELGDDWDLEIINFIINKLEIMAMAEKLSKKDKTRPILLKMQRQRDEMFIDEVYKMSEFDGYTCFDSGRSIVSYGSTDNGFKFINKGKVSGYPILRSTVEQIDQLKNADNSKYISASGGIMTPEHAICLLENLVDSVQLCSTLYFNKFSIIRDFADRLK